MKTSIIMTLVFAATLSAPLAANAGQGAVKSLHGHHVAYRHMAFAKATALYAPAPRSVASPQSDRPHAGDFDGDAGFSWEPSNW